jgi:SAM-dependent methyltransferase
MVQFVVEYGKTGTAPALSDGRLDAPAFHRNHQPIWAALSPFLLAQAGDVLETGSGTGQHCAAFAALTPNLTWWPSDLYDSHLASISAWRNQAKLENMRAPQRIDLNDPDWRFAGGGGLLTAILCINVLHISPWSVSQNLVAGAGRHLRAGGKLFVYGSFKRGGAHTAPSNEKFDATLRAENPEWGVRDIDDLNALAQKAELTEVTITQMPANNMLLAFTRRA